VTRSRFRAGVVLAGLALLAGLWLAPVLGPSAIPAISLLWLLAVVYMISAVYRILRIWTGRAWAGAVVVLAALSPMILTAMPASPGTALRLPCPRNWTRLTTFMLRASPMTSLTFQVGESTVKICYSRPAARGRTMLGGKHVPFGQLWRTGANEPTTIITPVALSVAGVLVPPGRAALYTVPGPETWEIILNRSTSQWGHESQYSEAIRAQELGRAILRSETTAPMVERFRITAEPHTAGAGAGTELVLVWEGTRVRIPVAPGLR
jgi:hypothetical protein